MPLEGADKAHGVMHLSACLPLMLQMPPDWLFQTIWHLERDKQLAFVQTRWAFTNGYDNLLCW